VFGGIMGSVKEIYENALNGDAFAITIVLIIIVNVGALIYFIWWNWTYKYVYSEMMTDKATVTNMYYKPPKSTYHHTKNGGYTTTTPSEHNVYLKGEKTGKWSFDRERLYQAVRLDDEVEIEYREKFRVRRDNPRDRKFSCLVGDVVITPKGRRVKL